MSYLPLATATIILLAGVIDDFRSRKFHNWLFLVCSGVALIVTLVTYGVGGIHLAVLGFSAGFVLMLPLVLMRIVGAGDMKLLAAFGIVAGWNAVLTVAVASLVWGALFGLVQVVLKGQLMMMWTNLMSITMLKDRKGLELHTMPYTAALLMGWLTYLVYQGIL